MSLSVNKTEAASAVLGEIVWLYSCSKLHQNWAMGSIHKWILPALKHNQYRIYHRGDKPIGFVSWGWLSETVESNYARQPSSLKPDDWTSGDRGWIFDFVAPFGDARYIVNDLRHNVFPDKVGRMLRVKKGEKTMKIMYIHGAKAVSLASDHTLNPAVSLD